MVAVYGSLRKGLHNHRLLEDQEFKGLTKVRGFKLHRYCSSFPAVTKADPVSAVTVELYEVSDRCFESLDYLEGYPNFYNREVVELDNGSTAWMYFIEGELDQEVIQDGDWFKHFTGVS